jgi:hypothetical protein
MFSGGKNGDGESVAASMMSMNDNSGSNPIGASAELAHLLTQPAPGPSALELSHGLHFDVPEEQYHRRVFGLVSKHMLDLVDESPLTYKSYIETPPEPDEDEKEAFFIGKAVGCAVAEPERFEMAYACEPDFGYLMKHDASGTTKEQGAENRKKLNEWRAKRRGAIFLTDKKYKLVTGMAQSMRAHPRMAAMLASGTKSEVTVRWKDPETGLECKARWDLWVPSYRVILDYKSTQDARYEAFSRDCERYGYHDQGAFYLGGARVLGIDPGPFLFGVMKKAAPYLRAVYGLSEDALERGERRIRRKMRAFADCIESGDWPGLSDEIQPIELPRWARD